MVNTLNKRIFRVIKQNYTTYIAMTILTLLSAALFVVLSLVAQNLRVGREKYINENVREDIGFYSTTRIDNIAEIENKFDLIIEGISISEYEYDDKTVRTFSKAEKVNIPAILEGNMPCFGEIALDPSFMKANDIKIGDIFKVHNKSFRVSGSFALPNYSYILKDSGDFINDPQTFGLVLTGDKNPTHQFYQYSVKYNQANDDIFTQAQPLKTYLNNNSVDIYDWQYAKYNTKISILDLEVRAITIVCFIIPTLFMLIAAVLISIVQARLIKHQSKIIGTLYAQGVRKKELILHYLRYPIYLAIVGGLLGTIIGLVLVKPCLNLMLSFFQMPLDRIVYSPVYSIVGLILCVVIFCLPSLASLKRIFEKQPAKLIRTSSDYKPLNTLERKLRLDKLQFKYKFAAREQLRSLPRLLFLVIGIAIASMFSIYGFIGDSSFDAFLNPKPDTRTYHHNIEYASSTPATDTIPNGAEPISAWSMVCDKNFNDTFLLAGTIDDSICITLFDKKRNRIYTTDNNVIVSKDMARRYRYNIGDKINFTNLSNDKRYSLEITHITDISDDYIFVSIDMFNEIMGWQKGSYNALMADKPLNFIGMENYKVKSSEVLSKSMESYTKLMRYFVIGISLFSLILGVVIIYIIASISIDESQKQISLMKVFGYKPKEIRDLILRPTRIFAVLGYLIGAPLGYLSIKLIFTMMEYFDISMPIAIKPIYFLYGFLIIAVSFEVSRVLSSSKIDNIQLSVAVKTNDE